MTDPRFEVLYEDNHLLVINKPPGLLSQPDATGDDSVDVLAKRYLKQKYEKEGAVYLGLVHRLDRPASGVMVLARTSKAARRLNKQFKQRLTRKRYLALVEGHCAGIGHFVDYLKKEDRQVRVVGPEEPGGARAELRWQEAAFRDGLTLVDIELITGRPHQVRVQFSERGFPILGDVRYGAERILDGQHLALHAYSLTLEHPTERSPISWQAAPPLSWPRSFAEDIAMVMERAHR